MGTETNPSYTNLNAGYIDVSDYTPDGEITNIKNASGLWRIDNEVNLLDAGRNCTRKEIVLNGNDRFSEREGKYFNLVQPYQHHTSCPHQASMCIHLRLHLKNINQVELVIFLELIVHLNVTLSSNTLNTSYNSGSATIKIYAVNYNILRVMSGMGGLAYSN